MLHPWFRLFFNIQQLSFVNSVWLHFVHFVTYIIKHDQIKHLSLWLHNCCHEGQPRVIVTWCKVHLGWSKTILKMLSIGTNVYVCACHIKIRTRWQHDKMVSISAATLEDKCLKITVACQEFKMGYFP